MRWAALIFVAASCAYTARVLRPLAGYDTPFYAGTYWSVVWSLFLGLFLAALRFIGRARLRLAAHWAMRVLQWPKPASAVQVVVLVTLLTAIVPTIPRYMWLRHTGSGGTAPFSAIEGHVLVALWRPLLPEEPNVSLVMSMIAATWGATGAIVALAWTRLVRRRQLSVIGVVLVAVLALQFVLALLRLVSPLRLPY